MDNTIILICIAASLIILVLTIILWQRVPAHELKLAEKDLLHEKQAKELLEKELTASKQERRNQEDIIRDTMQRNSAIEAKLEGLSQHLVREQEINNRQTQEISSQQEDVASFRETVAQLESINGALSEKLDKQEENLIKQGQNLIEVFKNEAQKAFEERSKKFTDENKANIQTILNPLNEKIKDFQHRVEETHKDTIDRHASLRQQIIHLRDLNETMSKEAQQLTKALKGDNKIQGNWGEVILQRVLEKSGLDKGREYEIQKSFTMDDGRKQPDVIIFLPDGKKIVIDSKVSLVAYERMINASEDEYDSFLKAHLLSLKTHIDQLSAKRYQDIYDIDSPDFVLMFVPIETAFSAAVNADVQIYNKAFDKNIVIVTPSTLLATLKTIDSMWTNEKQKRNSIEIATEAGKMYDKFVLLLADLQKIGVQMDATKKTYSAAINKLYEGSGNMIKRAEKLKKLGAKANKQIDDGILKKADE